jgi:hypothetical protein
MGAYLDRLNAQFDEVREGVEAIANRAAEDNREVTEAEQTQIDRDRSRLDELQTAIAHYTALEVQSDKVTELRRSVVDRAPVQRTTGGDKPDEYDIAREFPTAADYAVALHRAWALRDPAAIEAIDRATAHQKTTDNPGLIPRPILGPVVSLIDASRPFVNSCTRRALPTGKFDRPYVSQHVGVAKQAAEKDLTASQVMKVDLMPVAADTFAGHLNISRQDIKWTTPGILQLVFDDFAAIYAQQSNAAAAAAFIASLAASPSAPAGDGSAADFSASLFAAVGATIGTGVGFPDTLFLSPDVWASIGGMTLMPGGGAAFPSMTVTGAGGGPLGLGTVVDPNFPDGTAVLGPARFNEFYEDIDGIMQVQEPDVLGQLVGYAGFAAYLNVAPSAFTKLTGLPVPPVGGATASTTSGK